MALSHPELASRLPSGLHATPYTFQRWPPNTLGSVAPATSQRVTRVSAPALASRVPSGLQSRDRKSTRLNSSHGYISYAVFCLKKKKNDNKKRNTGDNRS